jgi:hypothetical protein
MQLVALITALAALWLSTWAVLTTRLTARMSPLPLLHPFQESDAQRVTRPNAAQLVSGHLSTQLINGGLGPAI